MVSGWPPFLGNDPNLQHCNCIKNHSAFCFLLFVGIWKNREGIVKESGISFRDGRWCNFKWRQFSMSRNYRTWTSIPLYTPSSKDQPRVIVKMVLIYMWSRFRSIQLQQDVFFGLKAKRLQSAPERAKVSICLELLSPKGDQTWGLWVCIAREHAGCLAFAAWSHLRLLLK